MNKPNDIEQWALSRAALIVVMYPKMYSAFEAMALKPRLTDDIARALMEVKHEEQLLAASGIREVKAEWKTIETVRHDKEVLLYCPDRGVLINNERIELGSYSTGWSTKRLSTMSSHPWATHWMPLPDFPPAICKGGE